MLSDGYIIINDTLETKKKIKNNKKNINALKNAIFQTLRETSNVVDLIYKY